MRIHVLRYPMAFADAVFDRLFAAAGAVALSQIPGYISHYVQRLSGHLAEAEVNLDGWRKIAQKTSCDSLAELIGRYEQSNLPEAMEAGRKCMADLTRVEELQAALDALLSTPAWQRSVVFLRHADPKIAYATLTSYVPNVPLDFESLAYAALGVVMAILFYRGMKFTGQWGVGRMRRGRKPAIEEATA